MVFEVGVVFILGLGDIRDSDWIPISQEKLAQAECTAPLLILLLPVVAAPPQTLGRVRVDQRVANPGSLARSGLLERTRECWCSRCSWRMA